VSGRVELEIDAGIARIEIDHPPVNALNHEVIQGLADAFAVIARTSAARVAIVRGAGDRAFVAGADIREFPLEASASEARAALRLTSLLSDIAASPIPVIARIHGHCLGGGLELAMACDLRIASVDASLGQPEVKLGLIPGAGGTQRLPRLIGRSRAFLLNVTGEPISGREACKWGLVDRAVPLEELDAVVEKLAAVIASQSPTAVRALTELHATTEESSLAAGLLSEAAAFVRCLVSADAREGVTAFLEKRPPAWSDRA
jgi:enoyl-CoA hydratase/carnithine racemase